jgi:hypothetical protein
MYSVFGTKVVYSCIAGEKNVLIFQFEQGICGTDVESWDIYMSLQAGTR